MAENIDESLAMAATFRFVTGEILCLNGDQIGKIPYLIALVSSADYSEAVRDKDGHYKLDPHIKFNHFQFILESLSFQSVRQLFTHLPKQDDVIAIIALFDFLGLVPQPDPTLNEVDSAFFSTIGYSPILEKHLQIIYPSIMQDMAVRFAIALAKEEYDFTKSQVFDQIYWFIMFILSANKFFGPRLQFHVSKIAAYCFALFQPRLLTPLNKLIHKLYDDAKKTSYNRTTDFIREQEDKIPSEQISDLHDYDTYPHFAWIRYWSTLETREDLLFRRSFHYYSGWDMYRPRWKELLRPVELPAWVYEHLTKIMYARLYGEICRRTAAVIREYKQTIRQEKFNCLLDDIFESELVQEELYKCILEELSILEHDTKTKHDELVVQLRSMEQDVTREHGYSLSSANRFRIYSFETTQEETLRCKLLLDKLHQDSDIVEEIHQRVVKSLRETAMKQFTEWEKTQDEICKLRYRLSLRRPPEISVLTHPKPTHRNYRIPQKKSIPKLQLKHSSR